MRPLVGPSAFRDFLYSLTPPHYACCISLCSVQDTIEEGVLSLCWCSLTLMLTTSIGIWKGVGAMKSWSSVVPLSCSCRISVCMRSNYDSDGWATRIIHFSLVVVNTVSIALIRQETISLAIMNHSFQRLVEGRLTFRDTFPVFIRTKRVNLLQSTGYKILHQRNGKRSLFRKVRISIVLTTANKEDLRRWLWQASIPFS